MNKSALALILALLLGASAAHAVEATGSFEEAKALAIRTNQPLLVDFYTEW